MSEKTARELLAEAYGEETQGGKQVETVENETIELTEEERELALREDIDSLPHMLKIRIGYIKRHIEAQEGKDNDNGNPDA
ncbi:hypothetical protein [Jeotgalibacillus haloalkalitolerans]|uniref:Uncharacterized protein n=1 Tax=Jeotgalibacillus haloalkalitolerans TaxID=3104292 RepID=A0ABU5KNF6_9BACL|nr:hypothetical protein [Jeotgalibacillus sp. HH7-29]MDZ5712790.1 hypothetical protein [Jeotgalibacillus sp. HH7-29]